MAKGRWRLTIRRSSKVRRGRFGSLDEALTAAREEIEAVRSEGGLPPISVIRDFQPGQRVEARIEVSGPGLLRGPEAGFDVMGDGALVTYSGSIRKQMIPADSLDGAIESVRAALGGLSSGP